MIIDNNTMVSTLQDDLRNAATYLSENSIDLGVAKGVKGGDLPYFFVRVDTAFAAGTSINTQLICADDAALTSNVTVLAQSGAIVTASLTVDKIIWSGKLPDNIPKRYLGFQYVVAGNMNAGTIDAGFTERVPTGAF
jgi:hypothetical protein